MGIALRQYKVDILCIPITNVSSLMMYEQKKLGASDDGKSEIYGLLIPNLRRTIIEGYQHNVPAVGVWYISRHWWCTLPPSSESTSAMVYRKGNN